MVTIDDKDPAFIDKDECTACGECPHACSDDAIIFDYVLDCYLVDHVKCMAKDCG